jgi:hypothetical protein
MNDFGGVTDGNGVPNKKDFGQVVLRWLAFGMNTFGIPGWSVKGRGFLGAFVF